METTADALVVVAYGKILPPWLFTLPPFGAVNVHASLLPRYRGAAPIPWAIVRGETRTGVTTMRIEPGNGYRGSASAESGGDRARGDVSATPGTAWR